MSIDYNLTSPLEIPSSHETRLRTIDVDDEVFQEWLSVRQTFMEDRGWHYGDDYDRYDADPATLHIVKERVETSEVMVGMRLTPSEDITQSLSWSMLAPHIQEQARANLQKLDSRENMWDLTRLVPGHLNHDEVTTSLLEIFGSGMSLTSRDVDAPPRWFFTTTPSFIALFKRKGVEFQELARGKNEEEDTSEVVFCYADPVSNVESLRQNNHPSYVAIQRGMYAV